MLDYKVEISKLVYAFNIKNDPLLRGFEKLSGDTAFECLEGCAEIVRILSQNELTLSDYLHDMLIFSDSPLIKIYVQKSSLDSIEAAIKHDLNVIRTISEISFEDVKSELAQRFSNDEFLDFPHIENGKFDYTADYFVDYAR